MIVATSIHELRDAIAESVVTIGNFDGVHLGHQKLIGMTCAKAKTRGASSVVVTFDPHPLRVLVGPQTPPFITLTDQKLELIRQHGAEAALVIPFTRELAALSPEEFVKTYLVDALHVRELVIGYDYHMGKGRTGDYKTLQGLGEKFDFQVFRLDPVTHDGAVVSSTRIRDMVQAGRVWEARPLLSRFYQVSGEVVHGMKRGGDLLGFPTANLKLVDELVPKRGVYAVWVELDGHCLPGVANIGTNPTFGNDAVSVEPHILDYSGDLYGRRIRVHFVQRLRDEKKFSGLDELKARIAEDVRLGRTILRSPEAQPERPCTCPGPATAASPDGPEVRA
ncbi:riboflavin kinase / FMN adenylyltransferase [Paucidesulfovibrio gracilis DSM 16080]|uniref:Riboflavin biosynthesis protein n=1 Tax=Paucidesulfovibrio gracilis DSM 16080 TaxID=1121449 RepID=A0A1T4W5Q8_9BACT|nr:bifunctional riboflavin kinase/FAD synthetase [Paucidesulfovibrio gracilis]SKA72041.1 riboflavin kinase / FMN adenylyltransferase [Paucidesulfovibrio gracilis DSM 16080]